MDNIKTVGDVTFKEPSKAVCEKHGWYVPFDVNFSNTRVAFRFKGCALCLGEAAQPFFEKVGFVREDGTVTKNGFDWPSQ